MQLQNLIAPVILFSVLGAALGLWILMLIDVGQRSLSFGARLAWLALLIFAPLLGLFVYYFTIVKPGSGVPEHLSGRSGRTLISNRGQVVALLSGVVLGIVYALSVTPVSIEMEIESDPSMIQLTPANE